MDYFYNSQEFFNRSKISDKDIDRIYEYIFSLSELYLHLYRNQSLKNKIEFSSTKDYYFKDIINSYLLKLAFKYLIIERLDEPNNNLYIIEKIGKLYILSGNYRGIDFLKKYMILELVIAYNKKLSVNIFKEKLLSIIGEKLRNGYLSFEEKIRDTENYGSIL